MAFNSYSHNLKKNYRVVFEKKLKITTTTTRAQHEVVPRAAGAAKKEIYI